MKKAFLLTLPVAALLAACGPSGSSSSEPIESSSEETSIEESVESSTEETSESLPPVYSDLRIACPAGAPAIALYDHIVEMGENIEINADPSNVIAYLSANSPKDIVIAPTNAGLSAIKNKNAPFKIAATLTFGNFFLASTGNDENGTLDEGDYVVAFQQNQVPDKIFKYCYDSLTNVHYVTAASDAAQALLSGKNISDDNASVDYVLMAEPALSNAIATGKNPKAVEYANLQTVFSEKSGGMEIAQASLFVNDDSDPEAVKPFLDIIKDDVASVFLDPKVLDESLEGLTPEEIKARFNAPLATVKTMFDNNNRLGLGYKNAYLNRKAIENFVSLFNITGLHEEVYYK